MMSITTQTSLENATLENATLENATLENTTISKTGVMHYAGCKRLGSYLVEAQLLSPAHVEVALNDQRQTGYRFGDIVVLRGWVERELLESIVQNQLLPERCVVTKPTPKPIYVPASSLDPEATLITEAGEGANPPMPISPDLFDSATVVISAEEQECQKEIIGA